MGTSIDIFTPRVEAQDEASGAGARNNAVNGHHAVNGNSKGPLVSPPKTVPYQASGGDSQRRTYKKGEGLTIERHPRSFSVLWTAREPSPAEFMHRLGGLVVSPSAGKVIVGPSDGGKHPFAEVVAGLDDGSLTVDFIHAAFPEASFTWQAANGSAKRRPTATSEIGVIWTRRNQFRSDLLRTLIDETATDNVAADVDDILESTEQLTSDFKPVAS